jgi:hypothetical protein
LKETRPLWPPQRGVGLQEPNLGKTNPRVSLVYSLAICFAPSLADSILFLTLTQLVVVFIFVNFSFALFTPPPLGDYHEFLNVDRDSEGVDELDDGEAAQFLRAKTGRARGHVGEEFALASRVGLPPRSPH